MTNHKMVSTCPTSTELSPNILNGVNSNTLQVFVTEKAAEAEAKSKYAKLNDCHYHAGLSGTKVRLWSYPIAELEVVDTIEEKKGDKKEESYSIEKSDILFIRRASLEGVLGTSEYDFFPGLTGYTEAFASNNPTNDLKIGLTNILKKYENGYGGISIFRNHKDESVALRRRIDEFDNISESSLSSEIQKEMKKIGMTGAKLPGDYAQCLAAAWLMLHPENNPELTQKNAGQDIPLGSLRSKKLAGQK